MSWTPAIKAKIDASFNEINAYITSNLAGDITNAKTNLADYIENAGNKSNADIAYEKFYNAHTKINNKFNELTGLRKQLTSILAGNETVTVAQKLKEVGNLQQDIIDKKAKLKEVKSELDIANTREKAIKERNVNPSYPQTFGYIFRPFRRMSYTVIVPLIFALFLTAIFLIWNTTPGVSITRSNNFMAMASAPPANNFNKILKNIRQP